MKCHAWRNQDRFWAEAMRTVCTYSQQTHAPLRSLGAASSSELVLVSCCTRPCAGCMLGEGSSRSARPKRGRDFTGELEFEREKMDTLLESSSGAPIVWSTRSSDALVAGVTGSRWPGPPADKPEPAPCRLQASWRAFLRESVPMPHDRQSESRSAQSAHNHRAVRAS
jgi:hypothetical protein